MLNKIIVVEGIIGVGKSEVLKELLARGETVIFEPFDRNKILPLFYKDPARWAFACQLNFLLLRGRVLEAARYMPSKNNRVFLERSILSDRYTFAEMLKEDGMMLPEEWESYLTLFDEFNPRLPDMVFYLRDSVENCRKQIKERGREMERWLWETEKGRVYLQRLLDKHDENISYLGAKIITLQNTVPEMKPNYLWLPETVPGRVDFIQGILSEEDAR